MNDITRRFVEAYKWQVTCVNDPTVNAYESMNANAYANDITDVAGIILTPSEYEEFCDATGQYGAYIRYAEELPQ
jgi:hypothetical protein